MRKSGRGVSNSNAISLETMESRLLLAGNVEVFVRGGNLNILGDENDNSIVVTQVDDTTFQVASGADVTTINGEDGPLVFEGVTRDLRANMRDGADTLEITDVVIRGISIKNGNGDNTTTLSNVGVINSIAITNGTGIDTTSIAADTGKNLKILNGAGDNTTSVTGSFINVTIKGGADADTVTLAGADVQRNLSISNGKGLATTTVTGTTVMRNISLGGSTGDATIALTDTTVVGGVKIINGNGNLTATVENSSLGMGDGNGRTANVAILSRTGTDTVTTTGTEFGRDVKVSLGNGDAALTLNGGTAVGRNLSVNTGNGNDIVTVDTATVLGTKKIATGSGDDMVVIEDAVLNKVQIKTGSGNDQLMIEQTSPTDDTNATLINGPATFDLGTGSDTIMSGVTETTGNMVMFGDTVRVNGGRDGDTDTLLAPDDVNLFVVEPVVVNID